MRPHRPLAVPTPEGWAIFTLWSKSGTVPGAKYGSTIEKNRLQLFQEVQLSLGSATAARPPSAL